jgi:hypothetical protein
MVGNLRRRQCCRYGTRTVILRGLRLTILDIAGGAPGGCVYVDRFWLSGALATARNRAAEKRAGQHPLQVPRLGYAIVSEAARLPITPGCKPLVRLAIRIRPVGCGGGFDVVEERLEYQVMKRLDPLTPDRLVRPGRTAFECVAQDGRAFGRPQLEPVLALQSVRPDHPECARGVWAIELFPEHRPGVVQTVSVQPGSGSDLRGPDAIEVRDERSDTLWRRRDNPLMAVPDLHPFLTVVLSSLRPGRAPSRDTAGLPGPRCGPGARVEFAGARLSGRTRFPASTTQ